MSILRLHKLTLYGAATEKAELLEELQRLGVLHLIPLSTVAAKSDKHEKDLPARTMDALRYLAVSPLKRRPVTDESGFDPDAVVEQSLENKRKRREVQDEIDKLKRRLLEMGPWGDFRLPNRAELGGYRLWFYVVPRYKLRRIEDPALIWQVVHQDHRNAWVVVISENQPSDAPMPVPRTHLGKRSLSELEKALERAEGGLEEVDSERWSLTRWTYLLSLLMARSEDLTDLQRASDHALDQDGIFVVQAWAAQKDTPRIVEFAESRGLACTVEEPGPGDAPPIKFENSPAVSAGEDMLAFYQLPGYRDWDPSALVYGSFAIFFAMILSDAGYGLLFAVGLAAAWRRLGKSAFGVRLRRTITAVTGASIVYGALAGSYFGVSPDPDSLLGRIKIFDVNDFGTMMALSLAVGAGHLILANVITAWNRRGSWTALASLGWAVALIGGVFLGVGRAQPSGWTTVGYSLLAGGFSAVLLFTSDRALRRPLDAALRLFDGVKGLTGISKMFGDVLSYLRLFALGLSSAALAVTFNDLGLGISRSGRGIGWFAGLLILALGHALNIVLGVMSGVVHGLRLNLIEFYGWSVSDEGRPFRAFRKRGKVKWKA